MNAGAHGDRKETKMIKSVSVSEAHEQQAEGAIYLDVRSVPEFEQAHPAGAYNIPLLHVDPATHQMRPNPEFVAVVRANFPADARLLVGCQAGVRSLQACQVLTQAGFTDLANVEGGFGGSRFGAPGWLPSGLPTSKTPEEGRSYEALRAGEQKGR